MMRSEGGRASLELEEAATKYALARQEELAMQIRKDLMILDNEAKNAAESLKWEALVESIGGSEKEEEGGTPWEPDEIDLEESGLFADMVHASSFFLNGTRGHVVPLLGNHGILTLLPCS